MGWLHAVLLITGLRLQRLNLQPPSDIYTMSVVHAVRGPGTWYPLIHGQHVNIQTSPIFTCCPWIKWYCVSRNKSVRLYHQCHLALNIVTCTFVSPAIFVLLVPLWLHSSANRWTWYLPMHARKSAASVPNRSCKYHFDYIFKDFPNK